MRYINAEDKEVQTRQFRTTTECTVLSVYINSRSAELAEHFHEQRWRFRSGLDLQQIVITAIMFAITSSSIIRALWTKETDGPV